MLIAKAQIEAGDRTPMKIDPIGLTQPAHGVMATRPVTAPDAAPRAVGIFRSAASRPCSQPSIAVAVAVLVFTHAKPAMLSAAESRNRR